ncbi:hypothetical protein VCR26J2_370022 [Vibrio coralliirubri]|nr:hypothetical protein VCR1J2_200784 [Vibrio coralliirubri]CDT74640.1 hypothetical protein VCR26J2_370022 [Vibrio coralliirubri]CDT97425.1 hypothetical protein VCR8J2_550023 [Vibrio coralliirubri]CDU12274.1 hypothetical protein VCR17J2_350438 [Vibrio coralliirubri]
MMDCILISLLYSGSVGADYLIRERSRIKLRARILAKSTRWIKIHLMYRLGSCLVTLKPTITHKNWIIKNYSNF